jgi:hypothetical protein
MLKDFEVANVKPSTAYRLLHQIDHRVYDPKAISNSIIKAKNTWLSDRGINTKAASAQVLVDYLTVSPDTSCIFLGHDPDSTLTGGAKKGRPKKSSCCTRPGLDPPVLGLRSSRGDTLHGKTRKLEERVSSDIVAFIQKGRCEKLLS